MKLIAYRKISYLPLLFIIIILAAPRMLSAVEVNNMYQVDVQVKEQSKQSRLYASIKGFKQILVRRSGSVKILDTGETNRAYKKVTNYLQKFEYFSKSESTDEYKYILSLYFEPRLIDDLIKRANQPLWDFNRPVTILWLAQEETNQNASLERRIIVENDNEQLVNGLLSDNSNRRAVPYILPLMDLEDRRQVSQSDIWGRFPRAIEGASDRYSINSIVIGKIYQRGSVWFGQFTYINQTNNVSFEHKSDSIDSIYSQMFDSLAEVLCEQYCVTQTVSEGEELLIEIENISNFDSFQKVKNYLSGLSAVRQVNILNINKDKALFTLDLLANKKAVIDSLSLNPRLIVVEKPEEKVEEKPEEEINIPVTDNIIGGLDTQEDHDLNIDKIENNDFGIEVQKILNTETIYYRWVE